MVPVRSSAEFPKVKVPEHRGKRALEWCLGIPDRCDDAEHITKRADDNQDCGSCRCGDVDFEQGIRQSKKKQEKGYVDERWDEVYDEVHVPPIGALVQELSYTSALERVIVSLKELHIFAGPLLDKCRPKRC